MLLHDLSEEILLLILQALPKFDLKLARLVCRRFSQLCSPLLISKVYISPQKLNLHTFTLIAEHPVFKTTVSEVVFDDTYFDSGIRTSKLYETGLRSQILGRAEILGQPTKADITPAILAEGFQQYQRCCQDQNQYTLSAEHVGRLCAGLVQMRHIRTLSVTDSWSTRSKASNGGPIFRSKGPLARSWDQLWLEPTSWMQTRHTPQGNALIILLRAAFITSSFITTVNIDPTDYLRGITHEVFIMQPRDLELATSVFQNVRHVNFFIDTLDGVDETFALGALPTMVGSAQCLESPTLGFDEKLEGDVKFDLDDVVGDRTWEHLSTLKLQHIALHQHQLSRLLSRHTTTLVTIELVDVSFYTGNWSATLRDLQGIKTLKTLILRELADDEREYDTDTCKQLQNEIMGRIGQLDLGSTGRPQL